MENQPTFGNNVVRPHQLMGRKQMESSKLSCILSPRCQAEKVVVTEGGIRKDLYLIAQSWQHAKTNTVPLPYDMALIDDTCTSKNGWMCALWRLLCIGEGYCGNCTDEKRRRLMMVIIGDYF